MGHFRLGGVQPLNEFLSRLTEYRVDHQLYHQLYRCYALCTVELCLARPNLCVSPGVNMCSVSEKQAPNWLLNEFLSRLNRVPL